MYYIIICIILVILSALLSGAECAFLSVNKIRLEAQCQKGTRRALRVAKLLRKKDVLINTLLVANDIVNIALSSVFTILAIKLFGANGLPIATLFATVVLLIFGEITPKSICVKRPDLIAYALSFFVMLVVVILRPIVFCFTAVSNIVLKVKGFDVEKKSANFTALDIKEYINSALDAHTLKSGSVMGNVFAFTDSAARDVMVSRVDVVAFSADTKLGDILESAKVNGYSYFPIYRKNIDDVIGVLYLRDLFHGFNKDCAVGDYKLLRPVLFVPGTNKMSAVFDYMEREKQSFAIVIDEYSGFDGILTKESIAKRIFG